MSDSEDDFHSADEGDDEIVPKVNETNNEQQVVSDDNVIVSVSAPQGTKSDCKPDERAVSCTNSLVSSDPSVTDEEQVTNLNSNNESGVKDCSGSCDGSSAQDDIENVTSDCDNQVLSCNVAEVSGESKDDSETSIDCLQKIGSSSQEEVIEENEKGVSADLKSKEENVDAVNSETVKDQSIAKIKVGKGENFESSDNKNGTTTASSVNEEDHENKETEDESGDMADWNNDEWGWEASLESAVESATSVMSSVLHTFESSLGIPDPSYMAKVVTEEEKDNVPSLKEQGEKETTVQNEGQNVTEESTKPSAGSSWLSSGWGSWGMSSLSEMVQSAGKDIVSGSLDTLEYLGKKTIDVISEQDPGLRTKTESVVRPFLNKKQTLSDMLKEAKQNDVPVTCEPGPAAEDSPSFRVLFEQFQGFTYLEALEMLSNECEQKLQRILKVQSDEALKETKETLLHIRNHMECDDEHDEETEGPDTTLSDEIKMAVKRLGLSVKTDRLIDVYSNALSLIGTDWPKDLTTEQYYNRVLSSLVEFTCRALELIHKMSELLLLPDFTANCSMVSRAEHIKKILALLRPACISLSSSFAEHLNEIGNEATSDSSVASRITELHLEGTNCASYIEDCQRLLLPILQLASVK